MPPITAPVPAPTAAPVCVWVSQPVPKLPTRKERMRVVVAFMGRIVAWLRIRRHATMRPMKATTTLILSFLVGSFGTGCDTQTQTGAAVGAGTGAVIGGIVGHQSNEDKAGAAIGAAAGGLAGA